MRNFIILSIYVFLFIGINNSTSSDKFNHLSEDVYFYSVGVSLNNLNSTTKTILVQTSPTNDKCLDGLNIDLLTLQNSLESLNCKLSELSNISKQHKY